MRDYCIKELEVLRYRPDRLIGSFRFDMAIVGKPEKNNPPKLLEVNEIGFDGLARSTFFQKTLLDLIPELRSKVIALDTALAEVRNMSRLGQNIVRLQPDCYNWDEEYLKIIAAKNNTNLHLISPTQYGYQFSKKDFPLLEKKKFIFKKTGVFIDEHFKPDAFNMSFALTLKDLKNAKVLYKQMLKSPTPQYGPLITNLVASKTILILLSNASLRNKLLGSSKKLEQAILPTFSLENQREHTLDNSRHLVIKHTDGCGGEEVFMGNELIKQIKKIHRSRLNEWVVQQKTYLNTIDVNGILSRPKKVISDLGVFVQYDWSKGKMNHFEVGGLMCRATNKGLKVNVSSGGLQVAVMLEKNR